LYIIDCEMVMPTILPLWEDKINWEMKKGLFCQIVGFPHIIGKVCLQSTEFDAGNGKHPAQIEAKIMTKICKTKGEKTKKVNKYLRFLPQIVFEKTVTIHYMITDACFVEYIVEYQSNHRN
jgi:hypothetical protein